MPVFEFHVSRQSRDRYQFDEVLFALSGNVILPNFHAARVFAQKMNAQRDLVRHPERTVRAGQLNAMGLIDEILHFTVAQYRQQVNPQAMSNALAWLNNTLGVTAVDAALEKFADDFPNVAVYRDQLDAKQFLNGATDGVPHRHVILEEMLMLWLANTNPAFSPFGELFDDTALEQNTVYQSLITNLYAFFDTQPKFGPDHQNLIDLLRAPALAFPDSLEAQLEFIRGRWSQVLGDYLQRLLSSLDLIKEEQKSFFFGGPGESRVPEFKPGSMWGAFDGAYPEYERFSRDLDWMPRLVLIAKSTYVWLDQLSKKYQRAIVRLDEIPDEELDLLAHRGFTGLWLIGIWQRSPASKRIKELCGAMNAEASAYSVSDYRIADDLGGDVAMGNLQARAWQRGIRVASDMVPNHMGIDSPWVIEHPDWFVASDYSPFPSYTFTGPNLSGNDRVGIYLEDHYFNRADAAVVFKRVDHWTGNEKFIYHGNDGTSFPWNDTAQLNFLNAHVREAVLQTILRVARQFPVIRLDAAMTLAKKHYQRLWFPQPGTGGDIPSRAECGLTKEQFDAAMPEEFWREVVDRVAIEAPDTLLLAEAFWLMEGYFVRTLGMHRVYNSAFMNMLRDEKNANYRSVIKNTIEFDPEILKRYVNFLNNPDERTAAEQFGTGDKYFGIATLLSTLPGLPMFGHGQIEGLTERYGMEFRRAMWDEQPNAHLVARHEREISPLLHRRHIFAGVDNFALYDFFSNDGVVNEDVFAYSNRVNDERGLVIFHNKFANTAGWIRVSAASLDKGSGNLVQRTLSDALVLSTDENDFVIFRDQVSGLEYIRSCRDVSERGLYVELGAYHRHVFLDFRVVGDNARGEYAQLNHLLNGRGVPSVDQALREIYMQPIHQPFGALVNAETFRELLQVRSLTKTRTKKKSAASLLLDRIEEKYLQFIRQAQHFSGGAADEMALASMTRQMRGELETLVRLPKLRVTKTSARGFAPALKFVRAFLADDAARVTMFAWVFVHNLAQVQGTKDYVARSRAWLDEWMLGKLIANALRDCGLSETQIGDALAAIKVMTAHQLWHASIGSRKRKINLISVWLKDAEVERFWQVNRYNNILWFSKEYFEAMLGWLFASAVVSLGVDKTAQQKKIVVTHTQIKNLFAAEAKSKYQVAKLIVAANSTK